MSSLTILIPSTGRAKSQKTLSNLPSWINPTLVVYPEQYKEYKENNPNVNIVCSEGVKGIAQRREWMMKKLADGITWMMDDDLSFRRSYHVEDKHTVPHRKMLDEDWKDLIPMVESAVELGFSVGGLFTRNSPLKRHYYPAVHMRRCFNNWWLDTNTLDMDSVNWTEIDLAEDFDVQAQFIQQGAKSLLITEFNSCPGDTQAAGGCSTYRTVQNHNEAQLKLKAKYPDAVRLKESKTKLEGQTKLSTYIKFNKLYPNDLAEVDARYHEFRMRYGGRSYKDEAALFKSIGDADWKARGMDVRYAKILAEREKDVH